MISMSVIALVIILVFLGVIGWFVNVKGTALNPAIRWIINAVLIITAIIIALSAFGVWNEVKDVQVPKL